ncbi:MAG: hypothetical protein LQ341_004244 [Variospora aurantia]|nr:MAG: hypothetical protein LQ341_004244 [Variospora aurantia]
MSGRRTSNNRIRGPQSALTDFLASNNISAAQISADYERRRREAQERAEQEAAANGTIAEEDEQQPDERDETALQKKKRKRAEEKALAEIKQGKSSKKHKKSKKGNPEGDDSDDAFGMYTKSKPLPGQLENCEKCEKRFTVTAYSKTGAEGGLLCMKCSKELTDQKKKDDKVKKQAAAPRGRQRQKQSNLLDGIVGDGAVSLQDLCIKTIADNVHHLEELGDLPQSLLKRLSEIFSKRRVLLPRTLDLFLRSGLETIELTDCGKLEVEDYIKIFSFAPQIHTLSLQNAGQFKDEVIDYIMERDIPIQNLKLYAANLILNSKWIEYFTKCGHRLESLQLKWLNCSLDDEAFMHLVEHCPNLKRLKLKQCWQLGDPAVAAMQHFQKLEHLSLHFKEPVSAESLVAMITAIGPNLRTLSLEAFYNADDSVLQAIHTHCTRLEKLRLTENDACTDAGYTELFTHWANPPLTFLDLSSNRSLDCDKPEGTEDLAGLATSGFEAMMAHSGSALRTLTIASCRHIEREGLANVWDGKKEYPCLKTADVSFVKRMDTMVVAGLFKSCPQLTKLTAFGCFSVSDVMVPKGVALIGVPNAQDSIVQEGGYDLDSIVASMGLGAV